MNNEQKQDIQNKINKVRKQTLLWQLVYLGFVTGCLAGIAKTQYRNSQNIMIGAVAAAGVGMGVDLALLRKETKLRKMLQK